MALPPITTAGTGIAVHRRGLALSERKLLLATGDCIAVGAAFLLAFNLRTAEVRHLGLAVPRVALGIVLAVFLISSYVVDAYRLAGIVNLRGTFRTVSGSLALTFVGLLGVFFVVPYRITRPTLLLWLPLSIVALLAWRLTYRKVFAGAIFAGGLAVVADPDGFRRVWPDASGVMRGLYRVVEVVDASRQDCGDRLADLTAEGKVDQVIHGRPLRRTFAVSDRLLRPRRPGAVTERSLRGTHRADAARPARLLLASLAAHAQRDIEAVQPPRWALVWCLPPLAVYAILHYTSLWYGHLIPNMPFLSVANVRFAVGYRIRADGNVVRALYTAVVAAGGAIVPLAIIGFRRADPGWQRFCVFLLGPIAMLALGADWSRILALCWVVVVPLAAFVVAPVPRQGAHARVSPR